MSYVNAPLGLSGCEELLLSGLVATGCMVGLRVAGDLGSWVGIQLCCDIETAICIEQGQWMPQGYQNRANGQNLLLG